MNSERPFVPMQAQEQARPSEHVIAPSIANQDNSKNMLKEKQNRQKWVLVWNVGKTTG